MYLHQGQHYRGNIIDGYATAALCLLAQATQCSHQHINTPNIPHLRWEKSKTVRVKEEERK